MASRLLLDERWCTWLQWRTRESKNVLPDSNFLLPIDFIAVSWFVLLLVWICFLIQHLCSRLLLDSAFLACGFWSIKLEAYVQFLHTERWIPVDMEMSNNKQEDHCTTVVTAWEENFVFYLSDCFQILLRDRFQIDSIFCFQIASAGEQHGCRVFQLLTVCLLTEETQYVDLMSDIWPPLTCKVLLWELMMSVSWSVSLGGCSNGCYWTSCIWWWCTKLISTICVAGEEGHWTCCMWWRTEFRVWYRRYVSYRKRNCTQQICGKQGEQWKKAPWSQVCVCIPWNCSKSAVQRVMLLLHIVLLPNLLEAILLL